MQHPRDPLTADQLLAEGRALRALAQSLLGGDGEDALQEGYAAALVRPDAAARLGPWLAGTVRRLALRWRRDGAHRRSREAVAARSELDATGDPARIAEAADTAAAVANAVRALDEPFRSAIVLRYWRGLLPEQIAAELGVPHNTVRSRLQRGLERLRAQLDANYGDRSRSSSALVLLAHREDTVVAAAASGGTLLALGVVMKTKLMVGAALLAAVALMVPFLLDAPPAIARTDSTATAPPVVAAATSARELPETAPDREAAPVPIPTRAAAVVDQAPVELMPPNRVAPWLARFLVVDEDDHPVADATVTIQGAKTLFSPRRGITDESDGSTVAELRTDRYGVATATLDLEGVLAGATRHAQRSAIAMLAPGNDTTTKLVLEDAVVLRGIVVRSDGSPAAGATVTANVNGWSSAQRGRTPVPDPVITNAAGRFEMPLIEHGGYTLTATLDGATTLPVGVWPKTRTPTEVELLFPGGLSLRGVVVDAKGQPVAEAAVRTWRVLGDDPFDDERASGATDSEGRFAIVVKKRARYELIASADGHANSAAVQVETTAERPHADARLVLRALARIGGVVQRGDGSPFPGVAVFPTLDGWNLGSTSKPGVADRFVHGSGTTSGEDGRFTLTVDPGTTWRLDAYPIADNRWFRCTVADVAPGRDDVVVTIRDSDLAGCTVRGDVLTAADAQPVTAFDVKVVSFGADGEPRGAFSVAAEIDGHRFELPSLPLGHTFAFDVRPNVPRNLEGVAPDVARQLPGRHHDALAPVRLGPFLTTAAGLELHARVEPWGELPVQVLAADGNPVRDVFVLARRQPELDTGLRGSRRTDASGRALLKKCAPGPHRVIVGSANTIRQEQDVLVTAGANPEVIVRLPK